MQEFKLFCKVRVEMCPMILEQVKAKREQEEIFLLNQTYQLKIQSIWTYTNKMPYSNAFLKLNKALTREYLGKPVPPHYQKQYGKRYDTKDIKEFSYAVAKSRGIPIDK